MSFSTEWEGIYAGGKQITRWPWTDLVSLFYRHIGAKNGLKVLELGCGAGANLPFFKSLGCEYHAFEGSNSAVELLHREYPEYAERIRTYDFTRPWDFADTTFDLILDRAAVTHNDEHAIQGVLSEVKRCLKPGGHFIGVDWFSINHDDFKLGTNAGDERTRTGISSGQFKGVGKVHFSSEKSLRSLFGSFTMLSLEEKSVRYYAPAQNHTFASWNFVAQK